MITRVHNSSIIKQRSVKHLVSPSPHAPSFEINVYAPGTEAELASEKGKNTVRNHFRSLACNETCKVVLCLLLFLIKQNFLITN